ncbi:MAG TPA: hypothetical protein VLF66_06910 [Thermoanaerobaculia bacterium]|nr:hypothetical protein [Thermoanaerobaculia bacterium]
MRNGRTCSRRDQPALPRDRDRREHPHDLAIVTRGKRKPFQSPRGLQRLLDAYNERSEETVTAPEVHLHELCLVASCLGQEIEEHGPDAPRVEAERNRLRGVLRRAKSS